MAINPGVWGIDVGQCALKAIRLENQNGAIVATAFDYVEHPKILSQPDANPDELTKEALEKFLSRNPVKGDGVAMSVPGQSGLARFVKLPPVEEKKISDIVRFEAKQQIPFPLEEVVWDFQKISDGVVTDGFAMDTEIGLFAMKRDMINRFIGHFQAVKLEVHHVQMAPLALANFATYEMLRRGGVDGVVPTQTIGKKKCVTILDVGTDGSNLIITDGARIIWQRPIPVGGNHFTRALTKELKLTFAKAEHLKRNAAKSPELANILKALKPVLQEFVGEVQRSLGYFTNTNRDAQIDYMVGMGSAFKLPGLQKYLADKLQLDVRKVSKFDRVAGDAVLTAPVFVENILSYPVAYGLAIQGLEVARLKTNLLPPEITFQRKIRAKKPFAVAAAASLLLGTTVMAFGYSMPLKSAKDDRIEKAFKDSEGIQTKAKKVVSDIDAKKKEVEQTKTEVESIVAGQAERKNWINVNLFVYNALPIPGNPPRGNMQSNAQQRYWTDKTQENALKKYQERLLKGVDPLKSVGDDEQRELIPTIDIESIYARYSTDVKAVYEKMQKQRKADIGGDRLFPGSDLYVADWWKPETIKEKGKDGVIPQDVPEDQRPEGAAWVFEVRGTTYYSPAGKTERAEQFIKDTFIKNLIDSGHFPPSMTEELKKNSTDPVLGRISHVFLYDIKRDPSGSRQGLVYYGNTKLDGFILTEDASGMGGMPMGLGGMMGMGGYVGGIPMGVGGGDMRGGGVGGGGAGGSTWSPILSAGAGASGAMGGAGLFGVPPGAFMGGGDMRGGGIMGLPPAGFMGNIGGGMMGNPPVNPPKNSNIKPRFEFIVYFVWRENAPSDALRKFTKIKAPEVQSGGIMGSPPGGVMGGPPAGYMGGMGASGMPMGLTPRGGMSIE